MTCGKLQSHFGCAAFIALLQISRMRPLPGLDCRVGVPSEPCRLCQECEIFGRQRCFGVSLPKRSDGVVPCVPAVRVATLLNAILDELTHLASCPPKWLYPTTLHGMQRKCGRPPLAGCILDALTICRRRCPVTRASQPLPTPTNIWSVRSHRRPWTVQPI
jgi:hypothetical protein